MGVQPTTFHAVFADGVNCDLITASLRETFNRTHSFALLVSQGWAGMYENDPLESGLLYRIRMDGKSSGEYLQITLVPDEESGVNRKRLVKVLLLARDRKSVLQRFGEKDLNIVTYRVTQDDLTLMATGISGFISPI